MSIERIKQTRKELFERIVKDMESDGARWSAAWSFPAPHNPKTGTVYRGRNALLLTFYLRVQGISDPRFMTFNQARELGYKVAKGCHSYPIEKWKRIAYRLDDPAKRIRQPKTPAEWKAVEDDPELGSKYVVVGSWNLFNGTDLEGIEPYEPPAGLVGEAEAVDFLIGNSPCAVVETAGDEAFYRPSADRITVPARTQFADEAAMARVLLHEQGHATGAAGRLGREIENRFGSPAYAREELTAELSSLFTANEIGLRLPQVGRDDEFAQSGYWQNHVAYLKSWSSHFDDPASELMCAASRAGAASDWLMGNCFERPLEALRAARHAEPARVQVRESARFGEARAAQGEAASLERDLRSAADSARSQRTAAPRPVCVGKE